MQRMSVKARMVKSIGWENGVMEVEYLRGLIHQYHDVTEAEYIRPVWGLSTRRSASLANPTALPRLVTKRFSILKQVRLGLGPTFFSQNML